MLATRNVVFVLAAHHYHLVLVDHVVGSGARSGWRGVARLLAVVGRKLIFVLKEGILVVCATLCTSILVIEIGATDGRHYLA